MNSEARFPNACSATSGNCNKLLAWVKHDLMPVGSSNFFRIVSAIFWQFLLNTFFSVVCVEVLDVCQKSLASSCKRLELLDFVLLCIGCRSGLKWFGRWCSNSWNLFPESKKVGTGLVYIAFSFGWHRFEACVADRFLLWRGPWISDELLSSSRGSFCRSGWFGWFADVICSFVHWSCHLVRPAAGGPPGALTRVIDSFATPSCVLSQVPHEVAQRLQMFQ